MKTLLMFLPVALFAADPVVTRPPEKILNDVRRELVMLPQYSVFDNLSYRLDGATVTLIGQVTQPITRTNAEKAVKTVDGVRTVENTIEVLPLSPNDDRIRIATYRAIYGHAQLNRYQMQAVPPIHIIVKNGNLTLEGVVLNEADKNLAGLQANGVNGVFKVTNNLRTEIAPKAKK